MFFKFLWKPNLLFGGFIFSNAWDDGHDDVCQEVESNPRDHQEVGLGGQLGLLEAGREEDA